MFKSILLAGLLQLAFSVHAVPVGNIFGTLWSQSGVKPTDENIDQALVKVSSRMNESMPMDVDSETRLEKVTAAPGKHLLYHYYLPNKKSSEVDQAVFNQRFHPELKNRLCKSQEMQKYLRNGVAITYLYRGNDGQTIGAAKFLPSDCGYRS